MDNIKMTPEMLARAKAAASADELIALAKSCNIELDAREAKQFFAALHGKSKYELTESELDGVAGGSWERPAIPGSNDESC